MLTYIAYGFFLLSAVFKGIGLYLLSTQKDKPFAERKKAYSRFNWPANILIFSGVAMLIYTWYL